MATETNLPLELIRFKFTPEDLEFLSEHKEEWQAATRTERSKIALSVYEALKKQNKNWTGEEKKLKKDVCQFLSTNPYVDSLPYRVSIHGFICMGGKESQLRSLNE
jgi:hypothetical protein